jgi:hypothetical protein
LWPDENGKLILPARQAHADKAISTGRHNEPSELLSPRSRLLRRVRSTKMSNLQSLSWSRLWRYLNSQIIYSFEKATDHYFELWLSGKISGEAFGALGLAELVDLAGEELGLREDVIVKLVVKHTRPGAVFRSDGEIVTIA